MTRNRHTSSTQDSRVHIVVSQKSDDRASASCDSHTAQFLISTRQLTSPLTTNHYKTRHFEPQVLQASASNFKHAASQTQASTQHETHGSTLQAIQAIMSSLRCRNPLQRPRDLIYTLHLKLQPSLCFGYRHVQPPPPLTTQRHHSVTVTWLVTAYTHSATHLRRPRPVG